MRLSRTTQLLRRLSARTWLSSGLSAAWRAKFARKWRRRPAEIVFINARPFEVRNLKHDRFDETEALTTFAVAVAAVAREYQVNYVLRPRFVLILGSETDDIAWPQGKDWN